MLLEHLLRLAGINRKEAYITSVVQFFPPKNRAPDRGEIEMCRGFLLRQIGVVRPRLVIALGNIAASALLGSGRVMKSHGTVTRRADAIYFTTLHPAAAVRIKRNVPVIEGDFRKLRRIVKRFGLT